MRNQKYGDKLAPKAKSFKRKCFASTPLGDLGLAVFDDFFLKKPFMAALPLPLNLIENQGRETTCLVTTMCQEVPSIKVLGRSRKETGMGIKIKRRIPLKSICTLRITN